LKSDKCVGKREKWYRKKYILKKWKKIKSGKTKKIFSMSISLRRNLENLTKNAKHITKNTKSLQERAHS
jgi:hypothetical protein